MHAKRSDGCSDTDRWKRFTFWGGMSWIWIKIVRLAVSSYHIASRLIWPFQGIVIFRPCDAIAWLSGGEALRLLLLLSPGNLSWVLPFTLHYSRPTSPQAPCICRAAGCDWRINEKAAASGFLVPCSMWSGRRGLLFTTATGQRVTHPPTHPQHSPSFTTSSLNRWPEQNRMAADMILTMPPWAAMHLNILWKVVVEHLAES